MAVLKGHLELQIRSILSSPLDVKLKDELIGRIGNAVKNGNAAEIESEFAAARKITLLSRHFGTGTINGIVKELAKAEKEKSLSKNLVTKEKKFLKEYHKSQPSKEAISAGLSHTGRIKENVGRQLELGSKSRMHMARRL